MRKRPSARLIVLDPNHRVLLFRFVFHEGPLKGEDFWATPGGALECDESFQDAAKRELHEETGILAPIGEEVLRRTARFSMPSGEYVESDERYFLVRVADQMVDRSGQSQLELRSITNHRWWSLKELSITSEQVFPEDLAAVIERQAFAGT